MKSINDIKKIAVLGAGTMGPGIAQMFAMGGYQVTMWTRREETREKAKETLYKSLQTFVEEDLLPAGALEETYARVSFAPTVGECVKDAQFVQETIVENKQAKIDLFLEIDKYVADDCIIASNTSGLNVFELVPERRLPQMVIAHWYSPAQLIPLVEVVKSEKAPQAYADITVELREVRQNRRPHENSSAVYCQPDADVPQPELFYLLTTVTVRLRISTRQLKQALSRAVVLGLCKRADFGGLDMTAITSKTKATPCRPRWICRKRWPSTSKRRACFKQAKDSTIIWVLTNRRFLPNVISSSSRFQACKNSWTTPCKDHP